MIRKGNEKTALLLGIGNRRWTGQLLIVLALSSLGCARGDWINETLTLIDVTGTWEGVFTGRTVSGGPGYERRMRWVLQQNGQKVRGEVQGADGAPSASIDGQVNGETFNWQVTGPFLSRPSGASSSQSYSGEATINTDEMNGRANGVGCPCTFLLRRVKEAR